MLSHTTDLSRKKCEFGGKYLLDNTTFMLYCLTMTARQIMKILKAHGWVLDRISGSHHIFVKDGCRPVPVPFHGNTDLGTQGKEILRQAGIKI